MTDDPSDDKQAAERQAHEAKAKQDLAALKQRQQEALQRVLDKKKQNQQAQNQAQHGAKPNFSPKFSPAPIRRGPRGG